LSEYVKCIFEIQPKLLKDNGIKGIITDLDNTLVARDVKIATDDVIDWFDMIQDAGIKLTIISNNNEERVETFSEPLNIPFIASAKNHLKNHLNKLPSKWDLQEKKLL